MRFQLLIISCVILSEFASAQPSNISFEHYTSENGLGAERVTDIVQDKFRFMWIATTDGLNRFDGRTFTVYHHDVRDTSTIPDDVINAICADSAGGVWMATNGGLCRYNFSDDRFHTIAIEKYKAEPSDPLRIYDVICSHDSSIWFITRRHLHVIRKDGSIHSFSLPLAENESVPCLSQDGRGNILIGTNRNAVIVFDEQTNQNKKVILPWNTKNMSGSDNISVLGFMPLNADSVWVSTWQGGLQLLSHSSTGYQPLSIYDEYDQSAGKWIITGTVPAPDGQLWVSSYGNGLSLFDVVSGVFTQHLHHDPSDSKSLNSDFVNKIFKDAFGTLWVGTNSGLDKYDPMMHQFSFIKIPDQLLTNSLRRLPGDVVENVKDPRHESIWISVSGAGLFLYKKNSNEFKLYAHEEGNTNSLLSNYVYSLLNDHSGKLWIGTGDGICTYDYELKKFNAVHCRTSDGKIPRQIDNMIEDRLHRIWIATITSGVFCYTPSSNELICYAHDEANKESLPENYVFSVFEDFTGRIWATTQSLGLCRLDEESEKWKCFRHIRGDLKSMPNDNVYALAEDKRHRLWVATESGLAMMNPTSGLFENYSTADGLCSNDIFNLHFDLRNHLWLATNNGLSDFDWEKKVFKNYSTADGLMANHVGGAFSITSDGTIYIGSRGGISYFNPEALQVNQRMPSVIITSLKIFDKPAAIDRDGVRLEPIHLSYRQNMISFHFTALNFTNAEHNRYAYKLEGFDHDWIDCGNRNSATYTNLNGGDYVFSVKAANNDGIWNEEGTSVSLRITPPYWRTWWFYLLVTFTIALSLFVIYRIRINQILRLQGIRQRIARDLHDDIGSTLSSITMMTRPKVSIDEYEKPKELLQTINKASRQAMDLMSDIVWSVNPVNDHLENVIIRMREYAAEILDAANIDFAMEFDPALQSLQLPMNKRKDFFLFYKEAVNNLAKYSRATKAIIRLLYHHRELTLSVSDNGIGFDTEKNFSGNGLKNIKARAASLNGKLSVTSNQNEGTVVWLSFRLSHDDGIAGRKPKK